MEIVFLKNKAKEIRKQILKMAYESNSAHISSSLCVVDILTVLYWDIMKINPKHPNDKNRDRFILSKGHAAAALYAVLADKHYFDSKLLQTYNKNGTLLGDHPIYGIPGVELATGSLGHGLPVACGMALNEKLLNTKKRIFVLISDAECQEGSVWEAILFAGQHKLKNLVLLIDYNKLQALGKTKDIIDLEPFKEKFQVFGWNTQIIDGNSVQELKKTLASRSISKPTAIICRTIGGKGVEFMENDWQWHYKNLDKNLYELAVKLIDK
jgi:transketolase